MSITRTGPESESFIREQKSRWGNHVPPYFKVLEYWGTGDPFFGGSADDRPLGTDGTLLGNHCRWSPRDVAVFTSLEEVHEACRKIPNRRSDSILGILPLYKKERSMPVDILYPRITAALRSVCSLTPREASACLSGVESEAVRHLGGFQKAIEAAWSNRHTV